MIIVRFENGRVAEFEHGASWEARGFDNEMYVHVLYDTGETICSYPLDDVAEVIEQ